MQSYLIRAFENDKAFGDKVAGDHEGYGVEFDTELKLPHMYLDKIRGGPKATTIKFAPGKLRLPRLRMNAVDKGTGEVVGVVGVVVYRKVGVVKFSELTGDDADAYARAEGLSSKDELKAELKKAYGEIPDDALLTIHYFERWEGKGEFETLMGIAA